jgi:hypothetical protein
MEYWYIDRLLGEPAGGVVRSTISFRHLVLEQVRPLSEPSASNIPISSDAVK